jgi:hypothetical protein
MKGRYLIRWNDGRLKSYPYPGRARDLKLWRAPWSLFIKLCREFRRQGLIDYQIRLHPAESAIELCVKGTPKIATVKGLGKQFAPWKPIGKYRPPNTEHEWHI